MAFLAKLRPMGPWRAGPDSGERSRASAILHSDAVYSALTHAMLNLDLLEPWLDATARNPQGSAVRFSSCFPFLDQLLFVVPPRSLWPLPPSLRVRWKSAKLVPTTMVSLLLNGRTVREDDWTVDGPSECLLPVFRGQAVSSPFRPSLRSGAAVDRLGEGVDAHRTACVEFHRSAGLWIAFDFTDESARDCWTPALKGALKLLADTGLGGERSNGWGRFEQPEFREGPLARLLFGKHAQAAVPDSKVYWLMSLFSPAEVDSVDWQQGSYSVAVRGGRVESSAGWGAAKRFSRVIQEGSVLVAASPLVGSAPDVAPDGFAHPVYRAGFALALAVAAKKLEPVTVEESTQGAETAPVAEADGSRDPAAEPQVADQDDRAPADESSSQADATTGEEPAERHSEDDEDSSRADISSSHASSSPANTEIGDEPVEPNSEAAESPQAEASSPHVDSDSAEPRREDDEDVPRAGISSAQLSSPNANREINEEPVEPNSVAVEDPAQADASSSQASSSRLNEEGGQDPSEPGTPSSQASSPKADSEITERYPEPQSAEVKDPADSSPASSQEAPPSAASSTVAGELESETPPIASAPPTSDPAKADEEEEESEK